MDSLCPENQTQNQRRSLFFVDLFLENNSLHLIVEISFDASQVGQTEREISSPRRHLAKNNEERAIDRTISQTSIPDDATSRPTTPFRPSRQSDQASKPTYEAYQPTPLFSYCSLFPVVGLLPRLYLIESFHSKSAPLNRIELSFDHGAARQRDEETFLITADSLPVVTQ